MHGTVSNFLPQRAYGFIHGEDGKDYFFHLSDVAGSVHLIPDQAVEFQPNGTAKGRAARFVQPGPMPRVTQVGPSEFILTRQNYLRGYEVVQQLGTVWGKANDPNLARELLKQRAIRQGANAVVSLTCVKFTEQEGCSNYRYTVHRFDGISVVVARNQPYTGNSISVFSNQGYGPSPFNRSDDTVLIRPHALVLYPKLAFAWATRIALILGLIPIVIFCKLFSLKPFWLADCPRPSNAVIATRA